jgi:hypothetical protein
MFDTFLKHIFLLFFNHLFKTIFMTATQPVTTSNNGIKKSVSKSAITLDSISEAAYQKEGSLTAQVRQIVTTKSFYPSKKVENNMQANFFNTEDFGYTEQEFVSEEARIAWIPVPTSATREMIQQKLDAANKAGATIYRVLSNAPILTDDQRYAIKQSLKTLDDFADAQVVRFPENEETIANGTANKLTLDKSGNVQYRRTFLWLTPQEDVDNRGNEVYLSAKIKAELDLMSANVQGASVLQGQQIM